MEGHEPVSPALGIEIKSILIDHIRSLRKSSSSAISFKGPHRSEHFKKEILFKES